MNIRHNPARSRFELAAEPEPAVCEYHRDGSVWTLSHTYVPDSLRGGGVAGALVKTALEHIKAEGGGVIPACSYVAAYIRRHPEYEDLVRTP